MSDQGFLVAVVGTLGSLTDPEPFDINCDLGPTPAPIVFSDWQHSSISGMMRGAELADPPPVGDGKVELIGRDLVASGAIWLETKRGAETWALLKRLKGRVKFSIGYLTRETRIPTTDERSRGVKRVFTSIVPFEASPVALPAEVSTRLVSLKSDMAEVEADLCDRRDIARFHAHAKRVRAELATHEVAQLLARARRASWRYAA